MSRPIRIVVTLVATLAGAAALATSASGPARAQPTADAKKEARERFDRGMRLFDEGDKAGALAELERAWALVPSPIVLYDIALVHASMGHAVEAVDAIERVLVAPSGLSAAELAHAKKLLVEQSARVSEIVVTCDVEGARVELDNLEVATTPLTKPLRVTAGTHVVGLFATGRIPSRKALSVAGRARETVHFDLAPLAEGTAQLAIETTPSEVDVIANGALLGTSPFASTLAVAPGVYEIVLRRRGYHDAKRTITLAAGARGSISAALDEDPTALAAIAGALDVVASEPFAVVVVDGKGRGPAGAPVRLAPGLHRLRVERAGFVAHERDVLIETSKTTTIRATLEPTAETRLAWVRGARAQRTLGWSLVSGGALLGGMGAGFLLWNAGRRASAEQAYEQVLFDSEPGAGRRCDPRGVVPASCGVELDATHEAWRSTRARDVYGFIGVGVGAAAALVGAVVLLRADDPAKYDRPVRLVPTGWIGDRALGLGLVGAF